MGQFQRRQFLLVAGALLAAPLDVHAQPSGKPFRVGHVSINSLQTRKHLNDALELGLREHGYTIGQNLIMDQVGGDGRVERLPELARVMVARRPDVIVTGVNSVTAAVMAATTRIPIVMAIGFDVVASGLVQSLARPGGNVTGVTIDVDSGVVAKGIEMLKEMLPGISYVGALVEQPVSDRYKASINKAASALGLTMHWIEFSGDLERDFAELRRVRADALLAMLSATRLYRRAADMAALARRHRLPSMFGVSDFVTAGGLMSYGPNLPDLYRRAARHVHRILKGANPGDLPVEQPLLFDLVINLGTAKALGLTIPPSLLLRADRVIE